MKITSKGQVTIPRGLRQKHGLLPFCEINFVEHQAGLLLVKSKRPSRGKRVLDTMMQGGVVKGSTRQLLRKTRGD